MNKILAAILVVSITGCSSMIQKGSISKAHETFQNQKYDETLMYIARAETVDQLTPDQKAELTYLKAETYEKMGQNDKATALYQYVKDYYKDSQYAYLSSKKLDVK